MRMNWVPCPSSEAGLRIFAGPISSAAPHSSPMPICPSPKLISAWPTRPSSSVTSRLVSNPNAFSSQRSAAIGSR